jgi:OOP family OmpA-OmpF porin
MKSILKKTPLLFTGVLLAGSAFAQAPDSNYVKPFSSSDAFRTWSIGVGAGVLTPYTIFKGKEDFINNGTQLGYNAFIKDQLLPSFGLQLSYTGGKIAGNNSLDGYWTGYNTSLKYAVDLTGQFTLANISWMHKQSAIQPYLLAGFGLAGYTPTFTSRVTGVTTTVDHEIKNAYLPLGFGFKFNVSPAINIDLGYQVNFVDGDNLDGFDFGSTFDKFSYIHAGLEFALGGSSKPQLATHNPVASMRTEYLMAEQRLQAQQEAERARNEQLRRDLDASKAALAAALAQMNANMLKFTSDSDNDGVPDFLDKCPNTPAGTKVDGAGCPLPVATTTKVEKYYITEQDRAIVKEAIRNLEFDFNKATIREHSFASLDRVAQLLIDKGFSLKLAGYTDNVGSQAFNLKLSKDRAESVKNYLVSKNADASHIQAEGYGKAHPIASNKTAKGRQTNRRVEFSLF